MGLKTNNIYAFGYSLERGRKKFTNLLRPYLSNLLLGFFLLLLTNLVLISLPILINIGVSIIEKGQASSFDFWFSSITFSSIYMLILAIVSLSIIGAAIRVLSRVVIFDIGRAIERDVRAYVFHRLCTYDDNFFNKRSVGDLMNHLTTDMTNIRLVTGFVALNFFNIIFVFCFTVPLLLRIDMFLAVCAIIPVPLVIASSGLLSNRMFLKTKKYQETLSSMTSHIQENLLGAHLIRLFHQQDSEAKRFYATNKKTYDAGLKLAAIRVLMFPIMRLIMGLSMGLVLLVGGRKVFLGEITLGQFVETNARILQISWPAMSIGFMVSIYSRGQASLSRINELMSYVPKITDGFLKLDSISKIEVRNLDLNRKSHSNISFSVSSKEMLGIVGSSGSYKTTLLRMLSRNIPTTPGTIFFDETDLLNLELNSVNKNISVVAQETFLFHLSIKDNIKFLRPDASNDELEQVLKIVRLDKDLENFKDGLDTIVGERGLTLSGGQRQRVSLARALLAKRSVIILDDALSAVDAETESHIVKHLRDFVFDSIIIIATHRLSAIRDANSILVLDKGEIVESGNHKKLMKDSKIYQQLWGVEMLKGKLS